MDRTMIHCPNIYLKSAFRNFKSAILVSPLPFALSLLCAMLFTLCPAAQAQQMKKVPRIAFLIDASTAAATPFIEAFRQGLRELGYAEGKQ